MRQLYSLRSRSTSDEHSFAAFVWQAYSEESESTSEQNCFTALVRQVYSEGNECASALFYSSSFRACATACVKSSARLMPAHAACCGIMLSSDKPGTVLASIM